MSAELKVLPCPCCGESRPPHENPAYKEEAKEKAVNGRVTPGSVKARPALGVHVGEWAMGSMGVKCYSCGLLMAREFGSGLSPREALNVAIAAWNKRTANTKEQV